MVMAWGRGAVVVMMMVMMMMYLQYKSKTIFFHIDSGKQQGLLQYRLLLF